MFLEGTNEVWGVHVFEWRARWDGVDELRVLEERLQCIGSSMDFEDEEAWRYGVNALAGRRGT